ncbi:hypothetical protein EMEDMD4_1280026 [Sinorhizobium medicae]|uniref:Xylulose 5-phosphate/Fructose 6-phosphate phosphoketolase C-terminal domain-containing protein n=1 Tax=Sinorhizobium medicae TaxID=110321 RepID=A0A508WVZ3_9HYPH|nr:hypothetical protein EMEDMD4_1280026 [Sinorhizobium medicae]
MDIDAAASHCAIGIGVWKWASNNDDGEPDVVMACAGDVPTLETLAAVDLIRRRPRRQRRRLDGLATSKPASSWLGRWRI